NLSFCATWVLGSRVTGCGPAPKLPEEAETYDASAVVCSRANHYSHGWSHRFFLQVATLAKVIRQHLLNEGGERPIIILRGPLCGSLEGGPHPEEYLSAFGFSSHIDCISHRLTTLQQARMYITLIYKRAWREQSERR